MPLLEPFSSHFCDFSFLDSLYAFFLSYSFSSLLIKQLTLLFSILLLLIPYVLLLLPLVMIGYGRVGKMVCDMLDRLPVRYIALDGSPGKAIEARGKGLPVFYGKIRYY